MSDNKTVGGYSAACAIDRACGLMSDIKGPVLIHRVNVDTVAVQNGCIVLLFVCSDAIDGEATLPEPTRKWYAAMRSARPDNAIVIPQPSLAILRRVGRCVVDVGYGIPWVNAEYLALLASVAGPTNKIVIWGDFGEVPALRAVVGQSVHVALAACLLDAVRVLLPDVEPWRAEGGGR